MNNSNSIEFKLEKELDSEITQLMNRKNSEFESQEEFYANNSQSLVLFNESKHEMFEKLKQNWNYYHRRITDFKQKKLLKFPQIYYLNYSFKYNPEHHTIEKKSTLTTKYTFNLEDDVEIDLGAQLFTRNSLGFGNIFTNFRFYTFSNKMFNNLSFSFGEKKYFSYETNFLINNQTLVDYIFKTNRINNTHKHTVSLYRVNQNNSKWITGLSLKNSNTDEKKLNLIFNCRTYLNNKSLQCRSKLGFEYLKLKMKLKESIGENFYTISEQKLEFNYFLPSILSSKNQIIYKNNNKFYKFGYFYNLDGFGLEIGYQTGGVNISIPFLYYNGDMLMNKEDENTPAYYYLLKYLAQMCIFGLANYITGACVKKYKKYKKMQKKNYNSEEIQKREKEIVEMRETQAKILMQIKPQADKNLLNEIDKGMNGLIIHFALYGNGKFLKKIMNELHFITHFEEYLYENCTNIQNEILDVTIPVRYLIKKDEKNAYSSIFFHQVPKTKIIGFINPIYKSDKTPSLLMKYQIGNNSYVILKKDSEIFQIPESLTFN